MNNKTNFLKSKEEINKYFNNFLPVRFNKLLEEYNISIIDFDFSNIKLNNCESQKLDGVIFIQNDAINIYYNSNKDIKEQRFIIATLIGYLQNIKSNKNEENTIKDYYINFITDDIFNNNKPYNKIAREILLPKDSFEKIFLLLKTIYKEEWVINILSNKFEVPESEIVLGIKDLGYDLDIDINNDKTKKILYKD